MQFLCQSIELNKNLIPPETFPRTMKRLRNIPKKMHKILQRIRTKNHTHPLLLLLKTLCQNLRMVCNCSDHTAVRGRTIAMVLDRTARGGTTRQHILWDMAWRDALYEGGPLNEGMTDARMERYLSFESIKCHPRFDLSRPSRSAQFAALPIDP